MYYLNEETKNMESIYNYQDYRIYLRDHYDECKKRNVKFSLRAFASKIDLNVSTITRILKGQRNISEETMERIISYLKLRDREAECFRLLVQYNQACNPADKRALYEQIRQFRKTRLRDLGHEYDEYFSKWFNIALRELINILPNKMKSVDIAKMLIPSPKPNDIRKSFNLLLRLGLVKQNPDGSLELKDKFISTPDEWTSTAIHSFQVAMADLGKQALDRFPKNERNISTLTLSLSPEGFSKTRKAIERVHEEIVEIAHSDSNANRIYELNLQLFPLSTQAKEQ
jgi:uncharacterized protein (TIGR02147 family)